MKKQNYLIAALFVTITFLFQSCFPKDEDTTEVSPDIIPSVFKVDIPESISSSEFKSAGFKMEYEGNDTILAGDTIYQHLRNFIHIGEEAGELVQTIMKFLKQYNINKPMSLTYDDNNDNNRTKRMDVVEGGSYDGKSYRYVMTITDLAHADNSEEDGGKGLKIFWSNNPVRGVAIVKPYNMDVGDNAEYPNTKFLVAYSEQSTSQYDKTMEVKVSGYPAPERYGLNTLWMFVGKKGDYVDIYGNSNHPNANFHDLADVDSMAYNWAFTASSIVSANIGVAEVGLPPSALTSQNRDGLLKTYSVKNTYERILREVYFGDLSDEDYNTQVKPYADTYLQNTDPPGYFSNLGFVKAGESPGNQYNVLEERINGLIPFSPDDVASLEIDFQ